MNRNIFIVVLTLCFCWSCKKESLLTYDIPDHIYFNYKTSGVITDSANVSFAVRAASVTDSIFKLPIAVTGAPKDHDRVYRLIIVDSNTTAVAGRHFVLPATFTVRAGRVLDSLPIKLFRTLDIQTKAVVLKVALQPGDDFKTDIKSLYSSLSGSINALTFKFNISDMLTAGNYWTGSFTPYFGIFSVKKVKLINQVTGMPLDYYTTNWVFDLQSAAKITLYALAMRNYLNDQKAAGHTVYEVDGVTEMKMGTAYQ